MTDGAGDARWDAPELSVRTARGILVFFERRYGRERLELAWRAHGLALPRSHFDELSNFFSYEFLEKLLACLVEASGDPDFLAAAGRWAASPESLGFAYYLLRGLGSPQLAYRKVVELGAAYNRVGEFTVEKSTATDLVLSYVSRVKESSRLVCQGRRANLAAFPTIWGLREAEVNELSCQMDGADCCRYELHWQRQPPATWRRWVGAVLGALSVPFVGPWATLAAVAGFFGGAWLDLRVVTRVAEEHMAENEAAMSRSLRELQERADEVFRANIELDQRVADRTRELAEALARLEALDAAKSEFFANVSHELRTPLTLVLAPLEERLSQPSLDPAERALLAGVRRNAQRLLGFIDDLLDLSRIDAGHLRLSVGPVDLARLAVSTTALFESIALSRGLSLVVEAPPTTADTWGDVHRLESVVSNLVANALKFTPRGGRVEVTVRDDGPTVRIAVADTGPGISEVDQPRIFERFFQVEGEGTSKKGGVGIGLALAKNLVELHGGGLSVESRLGHGATFVVTLPHGRAHFRAEMVERRSVDFDVPEKRRSTDHVDAVAPSPPAVVITRELAPVHFDGGRRPRVVVVEDNDDLRALLAELLAPMHDVELASDGVEGLELVRRLSPDLVLSDVMMPRMSGAELCAALRDDPALRATPVVLLTARSGASAALEGFSAGADDFVEKPFHPRVLLARIDVQLRLRAVSLRLAAHARLAAVGTLAAGVGHEVRNPVNAVLNGVRVLQRRSAELPADLRRLLDVVAEGAVRIERISAALLEHVSPAKQGGTRPVDVVPGFASSLALLEYRLANVEVIQRLESRSMVIANAMELNQVLLNLLDNSLRAGARRLWVRSADVAGGVHISVEDDGAGVPPEVVPRLFDPFFTTRAPGEGSGLGLYLSKLSVQRWGGNLAYSPRAGGGSVFSLELRGERA